MVVNSFPNTYPSVTFAREAPRGLLVFSGTVFEFGSDADEIDFPAGSGEWALVGAEVRLNKILLKT